ncbi:2-succinyl-5-enolpyruvyl-6-hydroxy-3-cyclohexene-1-carboxylate synthase [Robiginitalea biformata]|uniref:2-succinyl-5-enolpyruvyl-6-hydroxy-3-cyclohexene-1-carboxylate synthase n=1 Tax=Robiginitalea biformata (strain ATCC BAA-864 / DSM 15991 / KCTC 12146 / HTCC2501) TaxID=313596 RepID=A4CLP5_ROBBH|nr:thiamine pyrophosphate-binding protein [Robiginitalea biformata]EAR15794.1 2-succinyl-6-hydroxy-2,4-cyclohexadiene-1-carboxylic acid synthase/2-oxoglutarate decarboxylase [Robiginitalea biformata HTCC2501]
MRYTDIPAAHLVVAYCKSAGVRQVVLSPGSRNAPLVLGFTSDPYFECFSVVDERSAAFFALGLSQQSGNPTALVCTSGSALLNYYPAVAEAYYSRIPLLVLSADRPVYKIDIGDGQTIRQDGVYGNHIGFQGNLQQDVTHAPASIRWEGGREPGDPRSLHEMQARILAENEARVQAALQTAMEDHLPVHLNIPFEEPLYGTSPEPPVEIRPTLQPRLPEINGEGEDLLGHWQEAGRKMVLIGSLPPGSLSDAVVERMAADPSLLVFTETTSNLHHPEFFPSIDSVLAPIERSGQPAPSFEALRPDLLLTLGGMVVSKKVKQFLRAYPPAGHWHVGPHNANDTFFSLAGHVRSDADHFLGDFLPRTQPDTKSGYRARWSPVRDAYRKRRTAYLGQIPFSDFSAFEALIKAIPDGYMVQLANSSTVRYAQLFDMRPGNPVFCNRGTSGIEGSTSTAVGAAHNYEGPTLLLSGDLSFLYDINGLWNDRLRDDFRVIVINNGGGGIFRILPGKEDSDAFADYFETVHNRDMEPVCNMFGMGYRRAASAGELEAALDGFWDPSGRPILLEVRTPREINDRILLDYFDFLT